MSVDRTEAPESMSDRVLLVGDAERQELRRLLAALRRHYRVTTARDPQTVLKALRAGDAWQVILLAPAFSGEFSLAAAQELRARQPHAQCSLVVGSWLEGETRSGRPWSDWPRAYVDQWLARSVPADLSGPLPRGNGPLFVHAADRPAWQYLHDVAVAAGWEVLPPDDLAGETHAPRAIVYDVPCDRSLWSKEIARLRQRYPVAPLIALVNFPRHEEVAALSESGCAAVLGKPFLVDDLYRYLSATADSLSAVRAA